MGALTYNPSEDGIVLAKPVGALYYAVDARSTYYDSDYFVRRQFQSLAFVKTYFANPEFRKGWFTIYVNETGTLNTSTGLIDGGTTKEYWWRDNLTDGGLVEKKSDLTDYATLVYVNEQIEIVQEQVDELTDDLIQEIEDRQTGDEINSNAIEVLSLEVDTKANISDLTYVGTIEILSGESEIENATYANKSAILIDVTSGGTGAVVGLDFDEDGIAPLGFTAQSNMTAILIGAVGTPDQPLTEADLTLEVGDNKYDKSLAVQGQYIQNSDGSFTNNATAMWTGFIPCLELTEYSKTVLSYNQFVFFFDENHVYLSKVAATSIFETVDNAAYMAWNITFTSAFSDKDIIMVNLGSALLPYAAYKLYVTAIKGNTIKNADISVYSRDNTYSKDEINAFFSETVKPPLQIYQVNTTFYIRTKWSDTEDLVQVMLNNNGIANNNNIIDFLSANIIPNTLENEEIVQYLSNSNAIHLSGDDATPVQYNGEYNGAQHGAFYAIKINKVGHGKVENGDVGYSYTDTSGDVFTIVLVLDADAFIVMSNNSGVGDLWSFKTSTVGNLVNQNGGSNTGTVTGYTQERYQLKPMNSLQEKSIFIDDKEIVMGVTNTYYANNISFLNSYNVPDMPSLLAFVKSSKTSDFGNSAIAVSTRFSVKYSFNENASCTIVNTFSNRKEIALIYAGFVQSMVMNKNSNTLYRLIPDILPYVGSVKTWDYSLGEDISGTIDAISLDSSLYKTANKPPYRFIEYLKTGGNLVAGFAFGLSPIRGVSELSVRNNFVSQAYKSPSSTKKNYPYGIDAKLNISGKLPANRYYEAIGFRSYFNSDDAGNATAVALYKDGSVWVLMIDYLQVASFDSVKLPNYLIGKTVTVIEKTSNAILHNSIVEADGVIVSVDNTVSPVVAYLVLKIS